MRYVVKTTILLSLIMFVACSEKPATEVAPAAATAPAEKPSAVVSEAAVQIDPTTGFRMSGDWQLVRAHCTGCHSPRLITQQRGTAEQWLAMIRWMQKKQNLWQFDADTENRIIAYLSDNYPPDAARRRAAIPRDLMPPNPYSSSNAN